jgi:FMN phosphatase YigB (HAD superfamily)
MDQETVSHIIVFDLHDVLFKRSYLKMVRRLLYLPHKWRLCTLLCSPRFIYHTVRLLKMYPPGEGLLRMLAGRFPSLQPFIEYFIDITLELTPNDPMLLLAATLAQQGYPLYLFSNIGESGYQKLTALFPWFTQLFVGTHISRASNGWVNKPRKRAYRLFLDTFGLNPEAIIFIDDKKHNIRAAEHIGMTGITYRSTAQVKALLEQLLQRQFC